MEIQDSKIENRKSNAINVLLIMLTNMLAPLISNIINMVLGETMWTTERIIVLYFSAISGYVLFNKTERELKKRHLYEKGFKLGNSDAMFMCFQMASISMVMICYDSLVGSLILLLFAIMTIGIIWRDYEEIDLSPKICLLTGLSAIIYAFIVSSFHYEGTSLGWIRILAGYFVCQVLVCCLFDFVSSKIHKKQK